jgi:hypothetical protein
VKHVEAYDYTPLHVSRFAPTNGDSVADVALILTWDIQDGKEREFIEFYVGEFGPAIQRLGLRIKENWYTQAGAGPQVVLSGLVESADAAHRLIASPDFARLRERLFEYIEDFRWRVARPNNSGLQL